MNRPELVPLEKARELLAAGDEESDEVRAVAVEALAVSMSAQLASIAAGATSPGVGGGRAAAVARAKLQELGEKALAMAQEAADTLPDE